MQVTRNQFLEQICDLNVAGIDCVLCLSRKAFYPHCLLSCLSILSVEYLLVLVYCLLPNNKLVEVNLDQFNLQTRSSNIWRSLNFDLNIIGVLVLVKSSRVNKRMVDRLVQPLLAKQVIARPLHIVHMQVLSVWLKFWALLEPDS